MYPLGVSVKRYQCDLLYIYNIYTYIYIEMYLINSLLNDLFHVWFDVAAAVSAFFLVNVVENNDKSYHSRFCSSV